MSHVYVVDPSIGRVRMIRSASLFRDLDKPKQAVVGRANRFLHFQDMIHFRNEGLHQYDFGGYHLPSEQVSQDLRQVSDFKASFGGRLLAEANYLALAFTSSRRPRLVSQTRRAGARVALTAR